LELILDVGMDDVLEARIGAEAERRGAPRVEVARPAFDDALNCGIGLAADELRRPVAGDLA
jgi:hypothetical protein